MLDPGLRELLDLVIRWVHVVAAILWIGNSMLWNWIDRNLVPGRGQRPGPGPGPAKGSGPGPDSYPDPDPDPDPAIGHIWLLHSGAFYYMEKTLLAGRGLPEPLHWFKWQAYTTWITGALLLAVVYYSTGGALLLGAERVIDGTAAILIGAGLVVFAWPLYNALWRLPPMRNRTASAILGMALMLGLAFALTRIFSGRAAFLHVGAMLGTIMAGNVAMVIMPSQRQLVAALAAGQGADQQLADRAKRHSIHNNYITYPVIILMLSSHFPGVYGHPYNWLLLGVLVLGGAATRHFMNIRFTEPRWRIGIGVTAAATIAILYLASARVPASQPVALAGAVSFDDARRIIDRRCASCHSSTPSDRTFGVMPAGVSFDTREDIERWQPRILQRAVRDRTMPPANKTGITEAEREALRSWIAGVR